MAKDKKELYNERKKQGLCPRCGRKPDYGYVHCAACREAQAAHQRTYENQYRNRGVCARCGQELDDTDYVHCSRCRILLAAYKRESMKRRKNPKQWEWRDTGLCPRCGGKPAPGYTLCPDCCQKAREANAKWRKRYKNRQQAPQVTPPVVCIDSKPTPPPAPKPAPKTMPATSDMPVCDSYKFSRTSGLRGNTRKCHDCGKPTTDYRCPSCQAKWKRKNGVTSWAFGDEPDAVNL